jgi:hypothetical protein
VTRPSENTHAQHRYVRHTDGASRAPTAAGRRPRIEPPPVRGAHSLSQTVRPCIEVAQRPAPSWQRYGSDQATPFAVFATVESLSTPTLHSKRRRGRASGAISVDNRRRLPTEMPPSPYKALANFILRSQTQKSDSDSDGAIRRSPGPCSRRAASGSSFAGTGRSRAGRRRRRRPRGNFARRSR